MVLCLKALDIICFYPLFPSASAVYRHSKQPLSSPWDIGQHCGLKDWAPLRRQLTRPILVFRVAKVAQIRQISQLKMLAKGAVITKSVWALHTLPNGLDHCSGSNSSMVSHLMHRLGLFWHRCSAFGQVVLIGASRIGPDSLVAWRIV